MIALDEITVSATKRPQADALMPMATTILTSKELQASTLDPMADVARQSPGTNFMEFGRFGESYMTMRGVGTLGVALNSLDSVIGLSVDGVPTTLTAIGAPFLDVQSVEVLRGPQGTTFGRNAFAGSINVVNTPADGKREFRATTEAGSDGHVFAEGVAGGWLVDNVVAGRAAVRVQRFNGDVPNPITGRTEDDMSLAAGRGSLRITPDNSLTIDITGSWSRDRRHNPANILREAPGYPISGADLRPVNQQEIGSGSVKITKQFDSVILTSTTSYQDVRLHNTGDFTDGFLFSRITGYPSYFFNNPFTDKIVFTDRERIFNQEVRLNSLPNAPVQWVVGANYFRSDYETQRVESTAYAPTLNGSFDNRIKSQTLAAFADASIPLGHGFELSGGLRIAHDDQTLKANYVSNGYPGTVPTLNQRNSFDDTYVTGRLALSRRWNESVLTYVSAARGYASGGFEKTTSYAPFGMLSAPFRPASSWTYELGAKAQLTEGVRLNAALFFNDVKDGQLTGFDTATLLPFVTNQDFRSYGVEASITARLAPGLELSAGGALLRSRLVHVTLESLLSGVRAGNSAPQVPDVTGNATLNYRLGLEPAGLRGDLLLQAQYQFMGSRYSDVQNAVKMKAYHIVNGELGWEIDHLKVYAFGRNLLDQRPMSYAYSYAPGATAVSIGRGRVVGVGATVKW